MARYSDDPVRHVITFRVNQKEKKLLEQLAKMSGRTVSDFVRRNLDLAEEKAKFEPECSDPLAVRS